MSVLLWRYERTRGAPLTRCMEATPVSRVSTSQPAQPPEAIRQRGVSVRGSGGNEFEGSRQAKPPRGSPPRHEGQ